MTTIPPNQSMSSEPLLNTFPGGSVVQLVRGRPGDGDLDVVHLHDATINLKPDGVSAVVGDNEWSWLYRDLDAVVHSHDSSWTILSVPDVPDFGVSVAPHDVSRFRATLDAARGYEPAASLTVVTPAPAPTAPVDPAPAPAIQEQPGEPTHGGEIHLNWPDERPAPEPVRSAPAEAESISIDLRPPADAVAPAPPAHVPEEPAAEVTEPLLVSSVARSAAPPSNGSRPALAGLEARSISAWFGTHHVLDRVSLDMAAGKVTALIGPSGCGKSTFLRILNRMHEMIPGASLAGEVLLDGTDVYAPDRKLTDARRQIGMVFQKPNPFPAMSIYDNVLASFRLTGTKITPAERDDVVESCLSKAGLWNEVKDRLRQPGGGLSGGQQQRLCIARALAIRPRVLLMDEPCSALDPTSTRRIEQTIVELASEVTIVIVTHNMQQAARVSTQCAFFLAEQGTPGVIVEFGDTEAMFHAPQDERTSAYVNGRFG